MPVLANVEFITVERCTMKRAKIICFANQKGGVAKSTSCVNTASALTKTGQKVLAVDLDPQADTTDGFGVSDKALDSTIYETLKGECDIWDAIVETNMGDILVGSSSLIAAEREFSSTGREYMLKKLIASVVEVYDYILIDTPPELAWSTINALTASDWLVVPCSASKWSNKALVELNRTLDMIREYTNSDLQVAGILITKLDDRTISARTNVRLTEIASNQFGMPIFETRIHKSIRVDDAFNNGQDLLVEYRDSKPAMDYITFANELSRKVA